MYKKKASNYFYHCDEDAHNEAHNHVYDKFGYDTIMIGKFHKNCVYHTNNILNIPIIMGTLVITIHTSILISKSCYLHNNLYPTIIFTTKLSLCKKERK